MRDGGDGWRMGCGKGWGQYYIIADVGKSCMEEWMFYNILIFNKEKLLSDVKID